MFLLKCTKCVLGNLPAVFGWGYLIIPVALQISYNCKLQSLCGTKKWSYLEWNNSYYLYSIFNIRIYPKAPLKNILQQQLKLSIGESTVAQELGFNVGFKEAVASHLKQCNI